MKRIYLLATLVLAIAVSAPAQFVMPSDSVLRRWAAQMLMVGFKGNSIDAQSDAARYVRDLHVGAIVLFGVVEAATAGLTSIWFVLGSVAGLIAAICDGPVWLQLTLFFVVSIISLAATRPLVKKLMGKNIVATNADRVLGAQARVTEAIDNTLPTGAVYVGGKTWTARSESGEPIPVGTIVRIGRMEGVKLYVQPLQAAVHTETETKTK